MPSGVYIRTKPRKPVSEETRGKMSVSAKNKPPMSVETKQKISVSMAGNKNTLGYKQTQETCQKMSEARKGNKHPFYGCYHSEDSKNKMSISAKNRPPRSEETRDKMRKIWNTPEKKKFARERRAKQIFPYKDTKIEVAMQDILKKNKIEFKTHVPILGQPDIFIEPNICIFCDGDYFHANPKRYKSNDIMKKGQTAQQIRDRDSFITKTLESDGYTVLRFWEDKINNNINKCFDTVKERVLWAK